VYCVVDAWKDCGWPQSTNWTALLWLARHTHDKSMTVIISQRELGADLGLGERQARRAITLWRTTNVLKTLEHGGGPSRKPAKYAIDLEQLQRYAIRESKLRTTKMSGVEAESQDVHICPESPEGACPEIAPELRTSEHATPDIKDPISGHPCMSYTQRQSTQSAGAESAAPGTVHVDPSVAGVDSQFNSIRPHARPLLPPSLKKRGRGRNA
jgi:hypothetical protein